MEKKFKAWDNKEKKMLIQSPCASMQLFHITPLGNVYHDQGKVWDLTLLQYTGKEDKVGREIYEGDICRFYSILNSLWENVGKVSLYDGAFWIRGIALHCFSPQQLEIIGNDFENPELLKK